MTAFSPRSPNSYRTFFINASVHSRERAVAIIVPIIHTRFASNCHLPCLNVTISFISNEQHGSHIIFSLLVGQLGGIHGIVGIHIMDLLEFLRDRFLTPLTKQLQDLLHIVVFYQHHPHDVGIDLFLRHIWRLL